MEHSLKEWIDFPDLYIKETNYRQDVNPDRLCSYGIPCLDEPLDCIGQNELVVIGAETGSGKSELALNIALKNALEGKTVGVYYLEGGCYEAIQRIKWKYISDEYYKTRDKTAPCISFQKWINNKENNELLICIENKMYNSFGKQLKDKLFFYPSEEDFTLEKFNMSLLGFLEWVEKKLTLDLIVIDHLQYFSLTSPESNEIKEITNILRSVKKLTQYYNKPVILVSHLRKRGKNAGLPTHEDFYGSGNIAKIASTAVMISSHVAEDDEDSAKIAANLFPTNIRIAKSRAGISPNYCFRVDFDLNTRKYSDKYDMYLVNSSGFTSKEKLKIDKLPGWAEGAKYG
jgi:hypothetical protein